MREDTDQVPDGIRLLRIIYRWRKSIAILVIVAVLGAVIITMPFLIPPYFKAEVIFYPPNTNSSKMLIERDPRFGSDKEIEEQIQILKSSVVRDSIIKKYNLISHYGIDTTQTAWSYDFYRQLEDNLNIERTLYNSISVKVYDTDPVLASVIANDIVIIGDKVKSAIIKENLQTAFNSISDEYFKKSLETNKAIENLNQFIEKPISLRITQKDKTFTEKLSEQLDVQSAIENARKSGRIQDMGVLYEYQLKLQQLNEIQSNYFQAYVSLNSAIPSCYIITPAEPSYKKAGPLRLVIVLLTCVTALVFGAACAIVIEKFSSLKSQVINT